MGALLLCVLIQQARQGAKHEADDERANGMHASFLLCISLVFSTTAAVQLSAAEDDL